MGLPTGPASLAGNRQRAQRRVRGQVAEVVLALETRAPSADQSDLIPWQVPAVAPDQPNTEPDAGRGEPDGECTLAALPPDDPATAMPVQHLLRLQRVLIKRQN